MIFIVLLLGGLTKELAYIVTVLQKIKCFFTPEKDSFIGYSLFKLVKFNVGDGKVGMIEP